MADNLFHTADQNKVCLEIYFIDNAEIRQSGGFISSNRTK